MVPMATYNVSRSGAWTLTSTTADIVNLAQPWDRVEIGNGGTTTLWFRDDGTTAVANADGCDFVEPGVTKIVNVNFRSGWRAANVAPHSLSIVGNANPYRVAGVAGKGF
jgi:hypothetical protein